MKKISSIFLLVAMLISLISVPVFAANPTEPVNKPDFSDSDTYGGYFVIDEITDYDTELVYDADAGGYIYTPTIWIYVDPTKYYGMNAMIFKADIASDNIEFGYGTLPSSLKLHNYGTDRRPSYKAYTMNTSLGDNAITIIGKPNSSSNFTKAESDGYVTEFTIEFLIKDLELFKKEINQKVLVTFDVAKNGAGNEQWGVRSLDNQTALLFENGDVPIPKYAYIGKQQAADEDPYYTYTGDDANGYTIAFTDAYKTAIANDQDYTSEDGTTTYWTAGNPIKDPQYSGKTVTSAANLFNGMTLSKVDLSDYTLSDTATANMFNGFLGTADGIPSVGVAKDDTAADTFNASTGLDQKTLYFGNVTIVNYNDGNTFSYVYDNRATVDNDESVKSVTLGNTGNSKQYVSVADKYFTGFKNTAADYTGDLIKLEYNKDKSGGVKDLDTNLSVTQATDKTNNELRLKLDAQSETPAGVKISKAMAQKVTTKDGSNKIRFIALVDTGYTDYQSTGFVLSGVGMNPTRQAGYQYKFGDKIYKKLLALDTSGNNKGKVLLNIEQMNGLFNFNNGAGFEYTNLTIPAGKENTTYYATPYVELNDGTIVYGETKATSFNTLQQNDQTVE